jgi:uncharacterized membrane protein YfcA
VNSALELAALALAGFGAGAVNSVAGGGTLLTFPALLAFGIPATVANGTSTLALVPGSASAFYSYRAQLDEEGDHRFLALFAVPSIVGGAIGAFLVLRAGDELFARLVPWLILAATALFIVREPLGRFARSRDTSGTSGTSAAGDRLRGGRLVGMLVFQLFVAIYGGFFGAGIGIVMLAAFGLLGLRRMHRMNALKNFAAVAINVVAAVAFVLGRKVDWLLAGDMAVGAILGGVAGARLARLLGERFVRGAVVVIGLSIAAVMFVRRLRA